MRRPISRMIGPISSLFLALIIPMIAVAGDELLEQAMRSQNADEQISICTKIIDESKAGGDNFRKAQAYIVRAQAFKTRDRFKEALSDADAAVTALPGDPTPLITRSLVRHHDCVGAMSDLEQALKVAKADDRSLVLYTRARMWPDCGTRDKAIADYRAAISAETVRSGPIRISARMQLGTMLCESGHSKEAIKWLSSAATLAPRRAEPWLRRGNCFMDSRNTVQARVDYDKGISLLKPPKNSALSETSDAYYIEEPYKIVTVKAFYRRASLKVTLGDTKGAINDLQRVAEFIDEPPKDHTDGERREIAQIYGLRARLLSAKGETRFAAEDRAAACHWHASHCPQKQH